MAVCIKYAIQTFPFFHFETEESESSLFARLIPDDT